MHEYYYPLCHTAYAFKETHRSWAFEEREILGVCEHLTVLQARRRLILCRQGSRQGCSSRQVAV